MKKRTKEEIFEADKLFYSFEIELEKELLYFDNKIRLVIFEENITNSEEDFRNKQLDELVKRFDRLKKLIEIFELRNPCTSQECLEIHRHIHNEGEVINTITLSDELGYITDKFKSDDE